MKVCCKTSLDGNKGEKVFSENCDESDFHAYSPYPHMFNLNISGFMGIEDELNMKLVLKSILYW